MWRFEAACGATSLVVLWWRSWLLCFLCVIDDTNKQKNRSSEQYRVYGEAWMFLNSALEISLLGNRLFFFVVESDRQLLPHTPLPIQHSFGNKHSKTHALQHLFSFRLLSAPTFMFSWIFFFLMLLSTEVKAFELRKDSVEDLTRKLDELKQVCLLLFFSFCFFML